MELSVAACIAFFALLYELNATYAGRQTECGGHSTVVTEPSREGGQQVIHQRALVTSLAPTRTGNYQL